MEESLKNLMNIGKIFKAIRDKNVNGLDKALLNAKKYEFFNINSINIPRLNGIPILHTALDQKYNIQIIKKLIEYGADVNLSNTLGHLPLQIAIGGRYSDMAVLFIKNGADVNSLNTAGMPALICAINNNCTDIAIALIDHGADINQIAYDDGEPMTALFVAIQTQNINIVRKLIEQKVELNHPELGMELGMAFASKNASVIRAMIDYHKENNISFLKETECICGQTKKLLLCSGCKIAKYCSVECQQKDRKEHKLYCKYI